MQYLTGPIRYMVHARATRNPVAGMKAIGLATGVLLLLATMGPAADTRPPTDPQLIVHVLNRIGYGPRPGDVERVQKLGLEAYLRQQLAPESIPDDAVERKLAGFTTRKLTGPELAAAFREEQEEKRKLKSSRDPAAANPPRRPDMRERSQLVSVQAVAELQNEKIIRAVESERQFNEVPVDFWSNHFNIDIRKGACRVLKPLDEREVIRPHVFGKFRDLLAASARSPAMLVYLDNAKNSMPRPAGQARKPGQKGLGNRGGLNENYAREIMELHTLGVDGGYTQADVVAVARCLTGWTVDPEGGTFHFAPRRHDDGPKTVLGHRIGPQGGIRDGEEVLDILSRHPATARFIATKLCRRLVSDDPPPALVDRVAKKFLETDGNLRQVYAAILFSPEFAAPAAYRTKIKSPFEYAVSAVRATGATLDPEAGLVDPKLRRAAETAATFERGGERLRKAPRKSLNLHVLDLGQPLFAYQAPTGWPEDSRKWVNTGALIARLNFALAFANGGVLDVDFTPAPLLAGLDIDQPEALLEQLADRLLHGPLSEATRDAVLRQALETDGDPRHATVDVARLTALILGSPEFQRH